MIGMKNCDVTRLIDVYVSPFIFKFSFSTSATIFIQVRFLNLSIL